MTSAFIGRIEASLGPRTYRVTDIETDEIYRVEFDDERDLEIGSTAVLCGQLRNATFYASRVDVRKFLQPLYEEDLFQKSADFALVRTARDVFSEIYDRWSREAEERKVPAASEASPPPSESDTPT